MGYWNKTTMHLNLTPWQIQKAKKKEEKPYGLTPNYQNTYKLLHTCFERGMMNKAAKSSRASG